MIVKFLAKSKTFKGVRYNTNKVDKEKGELMKVSGFGILDGISGLLPQDYINYLNLVSFRNKRVVYPQLHAIISCKGKETGKEELTGIAEKWMKQMGYGDQPYLVIFHKDTRNHHVHIVSTRVDRNSGKKISSAFERIRAMIAIGKVLKKDEYLTAQTDLEKALRFKFSTLPQFMMILETKGYTLLQEKDKLVMVKFGRSLREIEVSALQQRIASCKPDENRAKQITAFLHRHKLGHSGVLRPETIPLPGDGEKEKTGYTSDLAMYMKNTFGIQLIFHGKPGKPAYGYTVLDHSEGNVFKGGELMDLDILTTDLNSAGKRSLPGRSALTVNAPYRPEEIVDALMPLAMNGSFSPEQTFIPYLDQLRIEISDDMDDEAIHGRNRQRKKQARTNTR